MRRFEKCTCKCVVYTGMNKSYYEGIAWRRYSYDLFISEAYIYLKKIETQKLTPLNPPKPGRTLRGNILNQNNSVFLDI